MTGRQVKKIRGKERHQVTPVTYNNTEVQLIKEDVKDTTIIRLDQNKNTVYKIKIRNPQFIRRKSIEDKKNIKKKGV